MRLDPGSSVAYGDGKVVLRLFEDAERNLSANVGLADEVGTAWPAWPVATPVCSNQGVEESEFRARVRTLAQWIRDHWPTLREAQRRASSERRAVAEMSPEPEAVRARLRSKMTKLRAPAATDAFLAKDRELLHVSVPRAGVGSIAFSEGVEAQFRAYDDAPIIRRALDQYVGKLELYGARGPFPEVEEKLVADVSEVLSHCAGPFAPGLDGAHGSRRGGGERRLSTG